MRAALTSGGKWKVAEMAMGEMPSGCLQRGVVDTYRLTDLQWSQLLARLPGRVGTRARGNPCHYRRFVEQVLWVVDQDVVWHELQPDRGSWRSVYVRFLRWSDGGIWPTVIEVLSDAPPLMEALQARIEEHRSYRDRCANSHAPSSAGVPASRRPGR
ncbi:transposase [Stenotrophomonas maltophilia]|uniref:transposase n=1 Tax=Stenotrophomonas maltophilia TaxID=40324 RepID=UPI0013DB2E93|nr:transposase [Stenotrophomonas maltophilia]MBN5029760.1 transposase [Stenotrophomonas maltophilia]